MTERERLIGELENYEPYAVHFPHLTVDGKLVLDILTFLREQPEIVRCKDCRNGACVVQVGTLPYITCGGVDHELDWFCADGKRR